MPSLKLVVLFEVIPFLFSGYVSQSCNGTLLFNETELKLFDLVLLAEVLVIVSFLLLFVQGQSTDFQAFRESPFNRTKNKNIKKP